MHLAGKMNLSAYRGGRVFCRRCVWSEHICSVPYGNEDGDVKAPHPGRQHPASLKGRGGDSHLEMLRLPVFRVASEWGLDTVVVLWVLMWVHA